MATATDVTGVTGVPQFPIDGLVSKYFYIDLMPSIKGEHEEMLFVESILSSLVDSFGDTFTVRITSGYRENNMKVATVLLITFPEFQWLCDVGRKAAVFENDMKDFLKIQKVYIRNGDGWGGNPTDTARRYDLSVKGGVYELKKTSKLSYVLKTIEDGVFKGTTYPAYSNNEVDF